MNRFEVQLHPDFDEHERVEIVETDQLTAIIAVHNNNLGPAVGGCRMFSYENLNAALTDVLRLSRGMTYKSALAGLPLGGGKSVIIGNPSVDKSRDLLLAMGDFVDTLGGQYFAAEDSGTGVADIRVMGERTRYVSGLCEGDRFGGDPSPLTAQGVFYGIRQAVRHQLGTDLKGIRVGIQGTGNVGAHLAELLIESGARVTVADVSERNLARLKDHDVEIVSPDQILAADVDVLAPCALGGAINPGTVMSVRASIIAGAANNQLASMEMGEVLRERGILYAPDYVINAGGIIDVYYQQQGIRDVEIVNTHLEQIASRLQSIFEVSDQTMQATSQVADDMARSVFMAGHQQVA